MMLLKKILTSKNLLPNITSLGVSLIAIGCIILGLVSPWFSLPLDHSGEYSSLDSSITPWFKVAVILCLCITIILSLLKPNNVRLLLLNGCFATLMIILAYPVFLGQRDSELIGDAAWLQQQHDSMTWLGGDVYRAHSERAIGWGVSVSAQDPPSRLALYRPPSARLSWDRITDWIWWLGYGPAFTQFVGKGWLLCTGGVLISSFSILGMTWRSDERKARQLFRKAVTRASLMLIIALIIGMTPVLLAGYYLEKAKASLSEGHYQESRSLLDNACRALPSLELDTGMLRQKGLLDTRLGQHSTSEAALFRIQRYEEDGYYARGRQELDALLQQPSKLSYTIMRECLRHQLRVAINEINTGQNSQASHRLTTILTSSPNCIQAAFHQQFLALQNGDITTNRSMHEKLQRVYSGIRTKNKKGLLAATSFMLAQAELEAGNTAAANKARSQSKGWNVK